MKRASQLRGGRVKEPLDEGKGCAAILSPNRQQRNCPWSSGLRWAAVPYYVESDPGAIFNPTTYRTALLDCR